MISVILETLGQQIINALTIGSMYTLVGVGFTLFFGVLGLINFAHGEVYMLGAFAGLLISQIVLSFQINGAAYIFLIFICAMAICAIFGVIIERLAYKPIRGKPKLIMLITSLAVSILLREGVKEFFPEGANPHPFFSPYESSKLTIGSSQIGYNQVLLLVISLGLITCLYLLVSKTWAGRSMRAISEDQEAAKMMGVNVDGVIRNAFLLGSALGGAAGVMNGLNYYSVRFDMGWTMAIKGFTAAVIGGLGNAYGAIVGGYILGALEVAVIMLIPKGSQYKDVIVFCLLIIVLVFRPSGILKKAEQKVG